MGDRARDDPLDRLGLRGLFFFLEFLLLFEVRCDFLLQALQVGSARLKRLGRDRVGEQRVQHMLERKKLVAVLNGEVMGKL